MISLPLRELFGGNHHPGQYVRDRWIRGAYRSTKIRGCYELWLVRQGPSLSVVVVVVSGKSKGDGLI